MYYMAIPFGNIPINRGGMPPFAPAGININPGGQFRAINTPGLSGAVPGMLPAQYSARASGQFADKYADIPAQSATNVKLVAIACTISAAVAIIVAIMFYYIAIDGYAKVPLPLAGQENYVLTGNGGWQINKAIAAQNDGYAKVPLPLSGQETYVLTGNGGWQINNAITVQNDVTSSRTLGKVYRNTTGKSMFVSAADIGGATWHHLQAFSDNKTDPTTLASWGYADGNGCAVSFWVINNNYYKVKTDGCNATILTWIEWY